jgi:xylan 1,4-beta-xylosidase
MHRRRFLHLASVASAGIAVPSLLRGQPALNQSDDTGRAINPPPKGFYPFSGISGPGHALVASSSSGGWRSGSQGVSYKGSFPPSYPTLPWRDYATGSAVERGLIPPLSPFLDVHVRDTIVCLGGDGDYYMTGSTGDNIWAINDGVELWRSSDLRSWQYLGLVWSIEKDGTWEKEWRTLHGLPSRAVWAPEIHFLRDNYYICLSMAPYGISILKSSTGKAEGPYVHAFSPDKPVVSGIDPTLFEDDDHKLYFTWGPATGIIPLKDDVSGFAGERMPITLADPDHTLSHHAAKCGPRGTNDIGHEGAVLFKANGCYYLGAADSYEGRYSTCLAMAENIAGPYRMRHESVPCAGGTGFFKDKSGQWWTSYFGNDSQSPFLEKPAALRIDFDPQGRVIVSKQHRMRI